MPSDQPHGVDLDEVPSRSPGRPTQSAAPELRAICLAAARQTFLEKGYSGATIEEIARRAKASKMTIYRQFGSKEQLFKIVAEDAIANARRKFDPTAWTDETDYKVALMDMIARMHSALTDQAYLDVLKLVISEKERFPNVASTMLSHDTSLLQPIHSQLGWILGRLATTEKTDSADAPMVYVHLSGLRVFDSSNLPELTLIK